MKTQQGNIYQWESVFYSFPSLFLYSFYFYPFIYEVGKAGHSWRLACEVETVSGRKLTLSALSCWGNEINSGSSCFHLLSFMLSVGFPLICWIYVLWRVALTESLLFFPPLLSFWASRSRALAAIIISRAAHTPTPFAPRRIFALEKRSSCHLLLCYMWDLSSFFFFFPRRLTPLHAPQQ